MCYLEGDEEREAEDLRCVVAHYDREPTVLVDDVLRDDHRDLQGLAATGVPEPDQVPQTSAYQLQILPPRGRRSCGGEVLRHFAGVHLADAAPLFCTVDDIGRRQPPALHCPTRANVQDTKVGNNLHDASAVRDHSRIRQSESMHIRERADARRHSVAYIDRNQNASSSDGDPLQRSGVRR